MEKQHEGLTPLCAISAVRYARCGLVNKFNQSGIKSYSGDEVNMSTKTKIKIKDDWLLREKIDAAYEASNQIILARWSLEMAKHMLALANLPYENNDVIMDGFATNVLWQNGKARKHDVRQAGLKIHQLARTRDNEIEKTVLRVVGQAVGSGHMQEHAMVASDYSIKVINLMKPDCSEAVSDERQWQLNKLLECIGFEGDKLTF